MRTSRIVGGAAAVLVAAGSFVAFADQSRTGGDSIGAADMPEANSAAASAPGFARQAQADAAAGGGGDIAAPLQQPPSDAARPAGIAPAQARVVKTATLTLSVGRDAVTKVADAVSSAAEAHNGYVAETNRENGDATSATLTVRVPALVFTETLAQLRKLGEVRGESLTGQDVTGALVDLDARLRSLRAQEGALNALMAKAATVGETLQVAQSVADVRTQIEQLAGQQAQLADQADFATIRVNVLGPRAAAPDGKTQPLLVRSFSRAGSGALAIVAGVIVVLGYALPTALLAALVFGAWRLATRRRGALGPQPEGA